jgi:hypothetical protein
VFRLLSVLLVVIFLVAGCNGGAAPTTPPDPLALVTEAAEKIRATDTFRMIIEQTGAPFYINTQFGANVVFRRAEAQYVSPRDMQATARLIALGLPTEVDIFARGENQWFRSDALTGGSWLNAQFAPGFNPETLISAETGFQSALEAMVDLSYVGTASLESGANTYELQGSATGEEVSALLANLVELTGEVQVKVYIDQATMYPARFVLVQPGTETAEEPEPTTWIMDIYDINAPAAIEDPEVTPEA